MIFREKLRRGRSHILLVLIMLGVSIVVANLEDENLTRETGKPVPRHADGLAAPRPD